MDSKATPIAHRSRGEGGAPALICFLFLGAVRAGGSVSGGGKNHWRA